MHLNISAQNPNGPNITWDEFEILLANTNYIEPAKQYYNLKTSFVGFKELYNIKTVKYDDENYKTYFSYKIIEYPSSNLVHSNMYYCNVNIPNKIEKDSNFIWKISSISFGVAFLVSVLINIFQYSSSH